MSKIIDPTPISVTRIRRNLRIEINYNLDGSVNNVAAHRWEAVQQAGVDVFPPVYNGATIFLPAVIPANVMTQLLALSALIDSADTKGVIL
jgi:hypothetical protein